MKTTREQAIEKKKLIAENMPRVGDEIKVNLLPFIVHKKLGRDRYIIKLNEAIRIWERS